MAKKEQQGVERLFRPERKLEAEEVDLFGGALVDEEEWRAHWWGMPSWDQRDCRPAARVVFNFRTLDDLRECARLLGLKGVTARTDSVWYPPEELDRPSEWEWGDR